MLTVLCQTRLKFKLEAVQTDQYLCRPLFKHMCQQVPTLLLTCLSEIVFVAYWIDFEGRVRMTESVPHSMRMYDI